MRSFGQEISHNRRRNAELSIQTRDSIISKYEAGTTTRELAEEFNCTTRYIQKTIARYKETGTNQSRPRSRCPSKLSRQEKRLLFRAARKWLKITYEDLLEETQLQRISKRTSYNALK